MVMWSATVAATVLLALAAGRRWTAVAKIRAEVRRRLSATHAPPATLVCWLAQTARGWPLQNFVLRQVSGNYLTGLCGYVNRADLERGLGELFELAATASSDADREDALDAAHQIGVLLGAAGAEHGIFEVARRWVEQLVAPHGVRLVLPELGCPIEHAEHMTDVDGADLYWGSHGELTAGRGRAFLGWAVVDDNKRRAFALGRALLGAVKT